MIRYALAIAFVAASLSADAQPLYKLIDKNGKVTYSGEAPKNFDGKVIRIDVNPEANTVSMPKPAPKGDAAGETRARGPRSGGEGASRDSVEAAKERLESARKALADARDNPGDGDMQWIGNKAGGTRAVPSDAYARRLEALEEAVKRAEEDLRLAEKGG
jgi:hypothetical protein